MPHATLAFEISQVSRSQKININLSNISPITEIGNFYRDLYKYNIHKYTKYIVCKWTYLIRMQ